MNVVRWHGVDVDEVYAGGRKGSKLALEIWPGTPILHKPLFS